MLRCCDRIYLEYLIQIAQVKIKIVCRNEENEVQPNGCHHKMCSAQQHKIELPLLSLSTIRMQVIPPLIFQNA
jgi:hypothetical protein